MEFKRRNPLALLVLQENPSTFWPFKKKEEKGETVFPLKSFSLKCGGGSPHRGGKEMKGTDEVNPSP